MAVIEIDSRPARARCIPEGYPFVGGFAVATLVLWWLWAPLGWIALRR